MFTQNQRQIFDTVKAHLLAQGKPALSKFGQCAYRSAEGNLSCAVGCLIKDEYYSRNIEGKSIRVLSHPSDANDRLLAEAIEKSLGYKPEYDDVQLMVKLQCIHDRATNFTESEIVEYWDGALDQLEKGWEEYGAAYQGIL